MVASNDSSPVSARKIRANRRNARLSTGPKTEQGKAVSSRNAVTHGVFAEQLLLPNEDQHAFDQLRRGIIGRLDPRDELELGLVNQVIWIHWRLDRLRAAERRAYALETEDRRNSKDSWLEMFRTMVKDFDRGLDPSYMLHRDPTDKEVDDLDRLINKVRTVTADMHPPDKQPSAGRLTMGLLYSGELEKLSRYEARLQNGLHRALAELRKLREDPRPGCISEFAGKLIEQNEPTEEAESRNSHEEEELADDQEARADDRGDEMRADPRDETVETPPPAFQTLAGATDESPRDL